MLVNKKVKRKLVGGGGGGKMCGRTEKRDQVGCPVH